MNLDETAKPTLSPEQVNWLKDMGIIDYSVDAEGLVNVEGNVDISNKKLTSIPVKFGHVGGDFDCSYNNLSSLQGAPMKVGRDFDCWNNNLTSLQGGPKEVGGNFYCHRNEFKSEPDHSFIKIGGTFRWK